MDYDLSNQPLIVKYRRRKYNSQLNSYKWFQRFAEIVDPTLIREDAMP